MKPENAAFAARMQAAIDDSGMSQSDLARRVGKSPQAVTGWLRTGTISKALLPRVAAELGKDLAYFMPADPLQKPPRMAKRATGKGHGETYKSLIHGVSTPADEMKLLTSFRKMKPEARGILLALAMMLAGCASPPLFYDPEIDAIAARNAAMKRSIPPWFPRCQPGTTLTTAPGYWLCVEDCPRRFPSFDVDHCLAFCEAQTPSSCEKQAF